MNKVIDKGFRSCRFVSTIVKHPVNIHCMQWRNQRFEPGGQSLVEGGPLVTVEGPPVNNQKNANTQKKQHYMIERWGVSPVAVCEL